MAILVLGASGQLGTHLVPELKKYYTKIDTPTSKQLNVLTDAIPDYNVIINCVAWTNTVTAEDPNNWDKVLDLNMWLPKYIKSGYMNDKTKVFHISTDYVYDGDQPDSKESDVLKPFNKYGISKALCDYALLETAYLHLWIIRTSFKPKTWKHPVAFTDVMTNADTTDIIAGLISKLIHIRPTPGIYNVGTQTKSVYDLVKLNNPFINPATLNIHNLNVSIKRNLTMDLTKFRNI